MQKRATARDLAEAAGVSRWTVMRAFTDGASISEDKKRRVLEAAEALNFSPNLLARSLATNLTHQVAVFVDDFANPQKLPYLEVLTDRLQAEGLIAMLVNINNHFDHVRALLNAGQRQVDAVILFGTAFRDETLTDRRLGRIMPPTFVLARDSQIDGVSAVVRDAERALREIVDHLQARCPRDDVTCVEAAARWRPSSAWGPSKNPTGSSKLVWTTRPPPATLAPSTSPLRSIRCLAGPGACGTVWPASGRTGLATTEVEPIGEALKAAPYASGPAAIEPPVFQNIFPPQ